MAPIASAEADGRETRARRGGRLRVLHVLPSYWPAVRYGGPINSVQGLCAALVRRGHDVHVFTTNVDGSGVSAVPLAEPVSLDGVSVTYFPTGLGRRLFRSTAMRVALERDVAGFDLVHLHAVFLWPTAAASHIARRLGVPYVLSPRGMLVPELVQRKSRLVKRMWIELFERHNLAQAASVHVTTEIEAEGIRRLGLDCREIAVIPNGVELPLAGPSMEGAALPAMSGPVVLFLGRINWKKGIDRLIPAMALVPEANLVIAGNDDESYTAQLIALARAHGVATRVHFVGPQYGAAKWQLMASADIFVLPSYSENFGIAVLEAMASGVPVVVTPDVGLAKAVSSAGAGLVVEGKVERIGAAVARLIANPDERRRMGEAGRSAAERCFSWDGIAAQMEELYREVTGARSDLSVGAATVR